VRANNSLDRIRKDIETCVGERVRLKANKGRKKTFVKEGIIESTYPSIFVVKIITDQDSIRRVSYSYSDVLTETVELTICSENRKIKCG
jgi:uncharacterized protein Veg